MMRSGCSKESNRKRWHSVVVCLLGIALLCVLVAASGCAHEQAYKRGTKLSRQGQYDKAIKELNEAIALAEKDRKYDAVQRYREKLVEVKLEAGRHYYRRAEDQFARADLRAARGSIDRCVQYCPQNLTYHTFRDRVLKAIEDAGKLRSEALALTEQRQWSTAVQRMSEALAMDRTMPGGQSDLRQIKDRAYNYYLSSAQDRLRANDLGGAEAQARSALDYRHSGREANAVLREASDRRQAMELVTRGRGLLAEGDGEEALDLLERAQRLYSLHAELPELLSQARRAVCDKWIGQGRRAMDAGDYAGALRLFQKSDGLLRGYGGAGTLIVNAKSRLAGVHLGASQRYLAEGMPGAGVLHAAAALGYQPGDAEALRLLRQGETQTRDEVRYTMAFVGIKSMPRDRMLAEMFASAAVEHMTRMRRAGIVLIERTDLRMILDERDLSASGLVRAQSRMPADSLHGVDALILGRIIDSRIIEETRHTGHGESIYQDGFRPEPNPDHEAAAAEVDVAVERFERAQARLNDAEARLARYDHVDSEDAEAVARRRKARADVAEARQRLEGAATKLGIAQVRLAATPRDVMVPNVVAYEYPIDNVTRTARIGCMIKILDTATGELILAETIDGRHAHSDDVVVPEPGRNVPADPLELPDDLTLIEEAAAEAIVKLKHALGAAARQHGDRLLVQMRHAETAGDMVRAVDNCVKYLFARPVRHDQTDRMTRLLRRYLGNEDGLVDVRGLLRTHGGLLLDPARFPAQMEERNGQIIIRRFHNRPSREVRCPCTLVSIDGQAVRSIGEVRMLMDHYGADERVRVTALTRDRYVTTDLQLRRQ
ncbi:MAG: CsgG/HfaB family protein [Planctomycetota bacterium]